jgi:hypothetical protein
VLGPAYDVQNKLRKRTGATRSSFTRWVRDAADVVAVVAVAVTVCVADDGLRLRLRLLLPRLCRGIGAVPVGDEGVESGTRTLPNADRSNETESGLGRGGIEGVPAAWIELVADWVCGADDGVVCTVGMSEGVLVELDAVYTFRLSERGGCEREEVLMESVSA